MTEQKSTFFDRPLSPKEQELMRILFCKMAVNLKTTFTCDDLREWGIHMYFVDPVHEVGAFLARLKRKGFIKRVGEEPSRIAANHGRRVDIFERV